MPLELSWIALIIGWLAGCIVNYLADVLPRTRRLSKVACPHCGRNTSIGDYVFFKRCKNCHRRQFLRNWIVQAIYCLAAFILWLYPPSRLGYWTGLCLLIYLGSIFVIDVEYRVVLNQMTVAGIILSIGIGSFLHGFLNTLIGGAAGFGTMLVLYYIGAFYARWMGRRRGETFDDDALGFGDVNLSGIIGLLLGWPGVFAGLFAAIILGGFISLIILIVLIITHRYKTFAAIPYAPFLVIGTVLLLYIR